MICLGDGLPDMDMSIPEPVDEFDDRILPMGLFRASMMLCAMTLVLQLFRAVCALIVYRLAVMEKNYWRKLKKDCEEFEQQLRKEQTGQGRVALKTAEMDLRMMNWVERLIDPIVDKIRGKSTTSQTSTATEGDAYSLKTDMVSHQVDETMAISGTKAESDLKVIDYLLNERAKEHECILCSITEDIDCCSYMKDVAWQGLHILGTIACLIAQLRTYNQLIFYSFGTVHFFISFSFIFNDSLGKLHIYRVLTKWDICGYRKVLKTNESVVLLLNLALFSCFVTLIGFYIARDDYIRQIMADSFAVI